MPLSSWIRKLFARKVVRPIVRRRTSLRLEQLEDRLTPSAYTVTDAADTAGSASDVTLRYAINQALSTQDQNAVIDFSSSLTNQTIILSQTDSNTSYGKTAFVVGNANITIDGSGAPGLKVDGGGALRPFAVTSTGALTLENLTLQDGLAQGTGVAAEGGAVYSSGHLSLDRVTVQNNKAQGSAGANSVGSNAAGGAGASAYGGGLYMAGGTATLTNDTLSGNNAVGGSGGNGGNGGRYGPYGPPDGGNGGSGGTGAGGGLYLAAGNVTLTNDTLSGNNAVGGTGGGGGDDTYGGVGGSGGTGTGGGLYLVAGNATLTSDTLSGNIAQGGNGGIGAFSYYSSSNGGNGGNGTGGGLVVGAAGNGTPIDTLIAQNQVTAGTGGQPFNGSPGASGTAADPDVFGILAASNHDLIGDGTGSNLSNGDSGGDEVGTSANPLNPLLGPLANNGGPTQTMALLPGSPAIGTGVSADYPGTTTPIATDQRGMPIGATPDIGAYQTNSQTPTVNVTDAGGVYTGSPYAVTAASVVGTNNTTIASFGASSLSYSYYAGTLTATQIAGATPLANAPTNAGKYTVVAQFTSNLSGYINAVSAPVPFTITQAPAIISITGASATYSGNAQAATGTATGVESTNPANLTSDLTLYYSSNSGATFTTSAPVNAGTYEVYYTFAGNTNYQAVTSKTDSGQSVTIGQASAIISITGTSATYNGNAQAASGTASGVESPTPANLTSELTLYYSSNSGATFTTSAPINAGTYEVYYTFAGNTNYQAVLSKTDSGQSVTIGQAKANIAITGASATYNGNAQAASGTASGVESPNPANLTGELNLYYSSDSGKTFTSAPVNAGTYEVYYTFAGAPNYQAVSTKTDSGQSVTIGQAQAIISITGSSVTYNGTAHAASGTASGVESPNPANLTSDLNLFYSTDGGKTFTTSTPVNAGTYEVYYTFGGAPNYQAVTTKTDSGKSVVIVAPTLLLLDPSGKDSLNASGNGKIAVKNGGSIVVDSKNVEDALASGNGQISAATIQVDGKPGTKMTGQGTFTGAITSSASVVADPLASLTTPAQPSTVGTNVNIGGQSVVTLQPGTYVGGLQVSGQAVVYLEPGIYYFEGGGLTVSGQAQVLMAPNAASHPSAATGTGVLIYNAPNKPSDGISVTGNAIVNLQAPTSGLYEGISIFQDRTSAAPITVSGNGQLTLDGTLYAAGATVTVSGNGALTLMTEAPPSGAPATSFGANLIVSDLAASGNGTVELES